MVSKSKDIFAVSTRRILVFRKDQDETCRHIRLGSWNLLEKALAFSVFNSWPWCEERWNELEKPRVKNAVQETKFNFVSLKFINRFWLRQETNYYNIRLWRIIQLSETGYLSLECPSVFDVCWGWSRDVYNQYRTHDRLFRHYDLIGKRNLSRWSTKKDEQLKKEYRFKRCMFTLVISWGLKLIFVLGQTIHSQAIISEVLSTR